MSAAPRSTEAIEVFFSYAHEDEDLRDELEKHLSILKRQGVITGWHDRKIGAGKEWEGEIDTHLNMARVILLLVSADFMASDYCWDVEVKRAMERHEAREARVLPVILRPVDCTGAPFGKLQALPTDARPVTSWRNRDEAFVEIAQGIRSAVGELAADPKLRITDGQWVLVLSATIDSVDKSRAEAIVDHLRKLSGDIYLTLKRIEPGSVKLVLKGSRDGFERIESLSRKGRLAEVMGTEIQDVWWGAKEVILTANEEHLDLLKQGTIVWNQWREKNPEMWPNLRQTDLSQADLRRANLFVADLTFANLTGADLREADLAGADLFGANLIGADLRGANLVMADLRQAELSEANLFGSSLIDADLTGADLRGADLTFANLTGADLREADLAGANLSEAHLVRTNFEYANLTKCRIHWVSAWELRLEGATQSNLIITPPGEPAITVDNLEAGSLIYLLLNNEKVRDVINTISSKVVLILGRFTPERKAVLDAIRDELRKRDYLPVLLDFDKPASRDLTETVRTLAHLARFIIADLTEPRSIPQELQAIVPGLAVPVQPLLLEGSTGEYGMFQDLKRKYHWVLAVYEYEDLDDLLASLGKKVIAPAEAKAKELEKR